MKLFIFASILGISAAAHLQYGPQTAADANSQPEKYESSRKLPQKQYPSLIHSLKPNTQPDVDETQTESSNIANDLNTESQSYFYPKPTKTPQTTNDNALEEGYFYSKPEKSFAEEPKNIQSSIEKSTVDYLIQHGYHYPKPTVSPTKKPDLVYSTTKKPITDDDSSQQGYYYSKPAQPEIPEDVHGTTEKPSSTTEQYPSQPGYFYPKPKPNPNFPTKVPALEESSSSQGYYYPKQSKNLKEQNILSTSSGSGEDSVQQLYSYPQPNPSLTEKPQYLENINQISTVDENSNRQQYFYPQPANQLSEEPSTSSNKEETGNNNILTTRLNEGSQQFQTSAPKSFYLHDPKIWEPLIQRSALPAGNIQPTEGIYSLPHQYIMIPILIDPLSVAEFNTEFSDNQENVNTYRPSPNVQYPIHQENEDDTDINTQNILSSQFRNEEDTLPQKFERFVQFRNEDQEIQQQFVSPQQISEEPSLPQQEKITTPDSTFASRPNLLIVPILDYQSNTNSAIGSYNFQYSTGNGIRQQEEGHQADKAEHVVEGSYSYTGPDNKEYTVKYRAGANGFQVSGAHLPIQPVTDEVRARLLAYKSPATTETKYDQHV